MHGVEAPQQGISRVASDATSTAAARQSVASTSCASSGQDVGQIVEPNDFERAPAAATPRACTMTRQSPLRPGAR